MSEDSPEYRVERRGVMKRLTGWQRLWLVGFVPWVFLNGWMYGAVGDDWLVGYWDLIEHIGDNFIVRIEPEALEILVTLIALAAAVVVPYVALYYLVKLSWRAALWVRAGFGE